jgi:hypothetical protein
LGRAVARSGVSGGGGGIGCGGGSGSDPVRMRRMKPDYLSFNAAISSLSKDQMYRNGGGSIGRACHDHLMSMLELYDGGSDARSPRT